MESISGFCDLCILNSKSSPESIKEICLKLISLGYKTVAVNYFFEDTNSESKKKKKKDVKETQEDIIPPPINLDFLKDLQQKIRVIHRLTIKFSDSSLTVRLNQSLNIRKYHLLAALPLTQTAFQIACSTFDTDIITFDPENKNVIKLSRKLYNQAINRGLVFELMYTPAIRDSTHRKNIIHMSHLYHAFGKSKQIIVSSWASEPQHVRSPYDIVNLGLIFGLSEQQAKYAITIACRDVILRAHGRRNGKTIMLVVQPSGEEIVETLEDQNSDIEMEIETQPALKKLKS
ncbi:ribonuclease P protein subunit p30, partial [Chrysoperla carnea]|uniref:ribonuclease P protein subunit p30 n=1 Tax=Chrysoperla carnea TaxID=189513 RepID=UPI001D078960